MKLKFLNEKDAERFSKIARKAGFNVRKIRALPVVKTIHPTNGLILKWEDVNRLCRWNDLEYRDH